MGRTKKTALQFSCAVAVLLHALCSLPASGGGFPTLLQFSCNSVAAKLQTCRQTAMQFFCLTPDLRFVAVTLRLEMWEIRALARCCPIFDQPSEDCVWA
jgi:hypothetical protein